MIDLAARLADLPEVQGRAPWADHEYVRGWGVLGLPFSSGHVLALRVFPESDFGSYRTIWHRRPDGQWSIFVDGPRLDTACPRYYGPACRRTGHAIIGVTWTGATSLRVRMDAPALEWTLTASSNPGLDLLNAMSAALPLASWRPRALVRARELLARGLGMGRVQLSGVMPSGHEGILMPSRMYFIGASSAILDGTDLGQPVRATSNPDLGGVPLPARGVLSIGQAMWRVQDPVELECTRAHSAQPD